MGFFLQILVYTGFEGAVVTGDAVPAGAALLLLRVVVVVPWWL